jgi:hypothetical protein
MSGRKVKLTWAHDGGIGKLESLVQIPELKKGERNKTKDEHPSLPSPELVVSVDADEEKLNA